jgi:predicted hydrocarbon binding protein
MLTTAKVPAPFAPPFEAAEVYVKKHFSQIERRPEQGTIHIGGDRYVLVRAESLYLAWYESMAQTFGADTARDFIYATGREIGRSDSKTFAERLGVTDGVERLAAGPIHFSHAGWAFVEISDDSAPATDDNYFLHYLHPNTFESEVLKSRGVKRDTCACHFSAGYSAGWCSSAFGIEVHARELWCTAKGDARCEFVMAPAGRLDGHEARLRSRAR